MKMRLNVLMRRSDDSEVAPAMKSYLILGPGYSSILTKLAWYKSSH